MRIATEERFGPVAPLVEFETEAQAIALANDTGLEDYLEIKYLCMGGLDH